MGKALSGELSYPCDRSCCMSAISQRFISLSLSGGYITGPEPPRLIKEAILQLCGALKDDAVALVDAIAPTDFILNSPIGKSDGQVCIVSIQFVI